jgi:hypothetical protein
MQETFFDALPVLDSRSLSVGTSDGFVGTPLAVVE